VIQCDPQSTNQEGKSEHVAFAAMTGHGTVRTLHHEFVPLLALRVCKGFRLNFTCAYVHSKAGWGDIWRRGKLQNRTRSLLTLSYPGQTLQKPTRALEARGMDFIEQQFLFQMHNSNAL
jgi:hypothetical protein